jgi:hypothetical protein
MTHQRHQAVVDAREVRDRLRDDQALRPARRAVDERGEDLRPCGGAHGEGLVDDGDPAARQGSPLDAARQEDLLVGVVPGTDEVTGSEQLGGRVVAHCGLAHEHAVEDEQADRPARAAQRFLGVPPPARHVDGADEEPLRRLVRTARVERAGELGVFDEELYGAADGLWHGGWRLRANARGRGVRHEETGPVTGSRNPLPRVGSRSTRLRTGATATMHSL